MDTDLKRRQVSLDQLNALLEFLTDHTELAKGLIRGRRGKLHTLKLWNLCAKKLNVFKDGATKDGKGWSKYWCDWKYRVRRRALELKAATDNNKTPPDGLIPLSGMEETIVSIIGDNAVDGVVIKTDPLGEDNTEDEEQDIHDTAANEYNDTPPPRKLRKRRDISKEVSDVDDESGPSSPPERKPRVAATNIGLGDEFGTDEEATAFLRIERQKLENSKKIQKSIETIATEITRLADIMSHIRDVLINNRIP